MSSTTNALLTIASDFARSYLNTVDKADVFPTPTAISLLSEFDEHLPEQGNAAQVTLEKLGSIGNQTTVNYNTGRYYGFVNGGTYPVGIAARWMADTWDQNGALDIMSPIAAKLEEVSERWVNQLLGLPTETKMGLVTGTSVATLCGLAAGRYRLYQRMDWDFQTKGFHGAPRLRIIMGRQTHGTVTKMISVLGFGTDAIEWVDCDDQGRLIVSALPQLDERCILILQAGNVCSGAYDDFTRICALASDAGAWVHVDGAFGLWAAASEQFADMTRDITLADSWSADGHKTLNTPYDCGLILCRDGDALINAMQQTGSYIALADDNKRDGMLTTPDMSRRARGIDLWAVLHHLGRAGVCDLVNNLHRQATYFAQQCTEIDGITVLNDVVFNQVMLQCNNSGHTQALLANIQASGVIWCGGAMWQAKPIIRISICSWKTTQSDIDIAIKVIKEAIIAVSSTKTISST